MTFGDALALVGIAIALLVFTLQAAASRRRDIAAARAVLLGVQYGMVRGWGTWFFSTVYSGEVPESRANEYYEMIKKGSYGQVFVVPKEPLVALVNSSAAGDLITVETVEAASLALYWVGVFNQLVQKQTDFNVRHLAEIRDDGLAEERREAIAKAASSISHMVHGSGIGAANADDGWYRKLSDAVETNIAELEAKLRSPRRYGWVAFASAFLGASFAVAGWTVVDLGSVEQVPSTCHVDGT